MSNYVPYLSIFALPLALIWLWKFKENDISVSWIYSKKFIEFYTDAIKGTSAFKEYPVLNSFKNYVVFLAAWSYNSALALPIIVSVIL